MSRRLISAFLNKCGGKKQLHTRKKARSHARRMTNNYGTLFSYYQCVICGKYHVGRTSTKKVR